MSGWQGLVSYKIKHSALPCVDKLMSAISKHKKVICKMCKVVVHTHTHTHICYMRVNVYFNSLMDLVFPLI